MVLIGIAAFGTTNSAHPEAIDSWRDRTRQRPHSIQLIASEQPNCMAGRRRTYTKVNATLRLLEGGATGDFDSAAIEVCNAERPAIAAFLMPDLDHGPVALR